ncbi:hypothetical protein J2128_001323 [Methanomicrobium sp. W14]|jgi:hypothetical protein|uniref:DUF2098 domain-containing protein n=1 Tax=Methanomicrobium sp. W14 TaxID=2817839 RepID=UPI001AEB81D2|nr:DUF2098 family protein [Methanomicrobium sp. W14]MBP2133369.1 hypothetical protein [Methanomicrobium sp. W14]
MEEKIVSVGDIVRYPRTGTTGRVTEIEMKDGFAFAKVDETGLFYRTDQLIFAKSVKVHREKSDKGDLDMLNRAEDLSSGDIEAAFDEVTGVGAG